MLIFQLYSFPWVFPLPLRSNGCKDGSSSKMWLEKQDLRCGKRNRSCLCLLCCESIEKQKKNGLLCCAQPTGTDHCFINVSFQPTWCYIKKIRKLMTINVQGVYFTYFQNVQQSILKKSNLYKAHTVSLCLYGWVRLALSQKKLYFLWNILKAY